MEAILSVLSEANGLIFEPKPAGYGWLLGVGMAVFYSCTIYILWGVIKSIQSGDAWQIIVPIEKINHGAAVVAGTCIPIMAVSILYEVIMRYAFNAPTKWAYEVSYMLMGTSLMLGLGFCAQLRRNIRVDFFYDSVSPKQKSLIDLVGYVFLLLPAALWLSWGLFEYFLEAYKLNERTGESAWNPIVWPFKFFFAFGFFLFSIQMIAETIKCILTLSGRAVPKPNMPGGFE
jgi:TRAP-type mannitol/chloroaromatic compound transport system permease small subunit